MAGAATVDVTRLIDERPMSWFNVRIVLLCFLVVFFDGYDIGAISFAGPALVRAWGITNMAALGSLFSATLFAMVFGGPLFGWIGDRYGRRSAIIAACLVIGCFSLASMSAHSVPQLLVWRFLTGVGIGGLTSNTLAMNAEFAPRRVRATMVIIMFTGITIGGGVPGPVAIALLPTYGWQVLFLIGGVAPLVMAGACALFLPESLKFLVVRGDRRAEAVALARRLAPGLDIGPQTVLTVADEKAYARFSPRLLFSDGLGWITPLLWLLFVCNLMSFYFVNTWLPTILQTARVSPSEAAFAGFLFQIGGTVGGLALTRPVDRFGFTPLCFLFVFALPVSCLIGYATVSRSLLMLDVGLSGFALLGLQFGLNAISVLIYPTAFRSAGQAVAGTVGRVGSVFGPMVAGVLIGMHLPIQALYLTLAVPIGLATAASLVLARLLARRARGELGAVPAAPALRPAE